jgi:hypothetical protein
MWIITAWQCITPQLIVKGFKKCCISNAVNKTHDDTLYNGSEEVGNIRSECEVDEGTDCEEGDSNINWERWIESDLLCVLGVRN